MVGSYLMFQELTQVLSKLETQGIIPSAIHMSDVTATALRGISQSLLSGLREEGTESIRGIKVVRRPILEGRIELYSQDEAVGVIVIPANPYVLRVKSTLNQYIPEDELGEVVVHHNALHLTVGFYQQFIQVDRETQERVQYLFSREDYDTNLVTLSQATYPPYTDTTLAILGGKDLLYDIQSDRGAYGIRLRFHSAEVDALRRYILNHWWVCGRCGGTGHKTHHGQVWQCDDVGCGYNQQA